jgi:hypothetical protein
MTDIEKRREANKKYRRSHPEVMREASRRYRKKNMDKVRKLRQNYYDRNSLNKGRHYTKWTELEEAMIVSENLSDATLCTILGRTMHAIQNKRHKLLKEC